MYSGYYLQEQGGYWYVYGPGASGESYGQWQDEYLYIYNGASYTRVLRSVAG